jgi:Spy/CpxP family protein refolding chaperone
MKKVWMVALATTMAAGAALAQMGPGEKGMMCGKGAKSCGLQIGRLLIDEAAAKKAGITEDQLTALRDAQYKFRDVLIELRAKREKARLELDKAMDAPKPDKAEIEKLIEQAGQVDIEFRKTMIRQQLEARDILGEEKYAECANRQWRNVRGREKGRMGRPDKPMCRERKPCPMMNAPDENANPDEAVDVEE